MAPTSRIYLTRHAQAEHNVDLDYSIPDAPLTPLGRKQASTLATHIPSLQRSAQLIVTSPLKRTLQTTLLGWAPAVHRLGGPSHIICLPQAQECNAFPCDTGSARDILEADPEFAGLDFGLLTADWTSKAGFWAADAQAIAERARWVRRFLRDRPEEEIVLVAHGDILRAITGEEYGWRNAECRVFTFEPEAVEGEECWLRAEGEAVAAGGYAPSSTEADLVWKGVEERL